MLHRENRIQPNHNTSAADLLKETLNYHHITQTDFADRIGVSQKHVSDLLHRKKFISDTLALRIEAVTGISGKLLLNLDDDYLLHNAKATFQNQPRHSPLFLKRYDWAD